MISPQHPWNQIDLAVSIRRDAGSTPGSTYRLGAICLGGTPVENLSDCIREFFNLPEWNREARSGVATRLRSLMQEENYPHFAKTLAVRSFDLRRPRTAGQQIAEEISHLMYRWRNFLTRRAECLIHLGEGVVASPSFKETLWGDLSSLREEFPERIFCLVWSLNQAPMVDLSYILTYS